MATLKTFKCRLGCEKVFKSHNGRLYHEQRKHGGNNFWCECGDSFATANDLYRHKRLVHKKPRLYSCSQCQLVSQYSLHVLYLHNFYCLVTNWNCFAHYMYLTECMCNPIVMNLIKCFYSYSTCILCTEVSCMHHRNM